MNFVRSLPFACLLLLAPSAISQDSLGPWKLGMTEAAAAGAGPSMSFTTMTDSSGRVTRRGLCTSVEILGQVISFANVTINSGVVSEIRLQGPFQEDFAEFKKSYESMILEVFREYQLSGGPEMAKGALERVARFEKEDGGDKLPIPGAPALSITTLSTVRTSNMVTLRSYFWFVTLRQDPSVLPQGPGNTVPPAGPVPEPETLSDERWSLELPGSKEAVFKRSLTSVNALLVRQLEGSGNAASAMKLSVTAVKSRTDDMVGFGFNQAVGEDMRRASEEVVRAIQVRHGQYPAGTDVQFGFADKWGGKDGPSAAVACALLLESLIGGFEIPSDFAVTGDLNADSTVQAVGGVADKIRGAMDLRCTVIGVPAGNEEDLTDLVVEESLRRFLTAKIFTLRRLDEAVVLVDTASQSEAQKNALADLALLQTQLAAGGSSALYAPETSPRLSNILAAFPNCYTAKILLSANNRQVPGRYSLAGTLIRIDNAMAPFSRTIKEIRGGADLKNYQFGRDNPLQKAKNSLGALKSKSDQRLIRVIDAEMTLIDQFQRLLNANLKSSTVAENYLAELQVAGERSDAEWQKIRDNKEIQDQFMQRGIQL